MKETIYIAKFGIKDMKDNVNYTINNHQNFHAVHGLPYYIYGILICAYTRKSKSYPMIGHFTLI